MSLRRSFSLLSFLNQVYPKRLFTCQKKLTLTIVSINWRDALRYLLSDVREDKSYLNESSNTREGGGRKNGTVLCSCLSAQKVVSPSGSLARSSPSARLPVCCQLSVSFLHRRFALASLPRARPPLQQRQYLVAVATRDGHLSFAEKKITGQYEAYDSRGSLEARYKIKFLS